ncbi:sarcosine oxidase subunit gamma [Marimonas arenosa]|uniref:Sarcosine oxidase subunit gamma n=1 Tax=Marimonas arenosa TaxID=1795305 RepID=A0AAE3WB96_9RHOB|nr:sarcosine oxidase subunit gamma [Marimonas arenosa]MDQ2089444.1 sarcosine oxidase subunit gamma [Marimonas arenosa]
MIELLAKTPCDGLLPRTIGTVTLTEISFEAITSVAPLTGQEDAVSGTLKAQMGAAFPKPGRTTGKAHARAVWSGLGQALVLGPALQPIPGAAMTDQTDAWACVALEGDGARDVLARLTPLDLRPSVFRQGHAARTELAHMSAVLMRTGESRYGIMAFRSMAKTLVHDVTEAMTSVAARTRL